VPEKGDYVDFAATYSLDQEQQIKFKNFLEANPSVTKYSIGTFIPQEKLDDEFDIELYFVNYYVLLNETNDIANNTEHVYINLVPSK
jgi:hypothetical protein